MTEFVGYWVLGVGGAWIISDGIYSWVLYVNATGYKEGQKQTFKRDHWIRLIRILIGFTMVISGWLLC